MGTFGPAYDESKDGARVAKQMDRVLGYCLNGPWRSLAEIKGLTGDPESSISAQLRHLRKERFGGYIVEKRRRTEASGTWEYRVLPPLPPGQLTLL